MMSLGDYSKFFYILESTEAGMVPVVACGGTIVFCGLPDLSSLTKADDQNKIVRLPQRIFIIAGQRTVDLYDFQVLRNLRGVHKRERSGQR